MNEEHVDNFYETSIIDGDTTTNPGVRAFLSNYFKTTKVHCQGTCTKTDNNTYKSLSGVAIPGGISGDSCIQTASGMTICGILNRAINGDSSRKCVSLTVDVNGLSQPNVAGRDIFSMDIHDDGSLSDYASGCTTGNMGSAANTCTTYDGESGIKNAAAGCLNNIIDACWKMEY